MKLAISDEYLNWLDLIVRVPPKTETPEERELALTEHVNELLAQHRFEWEQLQKGML